MTKLLMLGTNHFDKEGGEKIQAALEKFDPTHILVEGSRASHRANLAAKEAALSVIDEFSAPDPMKELILFERDGLLRDIEAVDHYLESHGEVVLRFFEDEKAKDEQEAAEEMRGITRQILNQMKRVPPEIQIAIAKQRMQEISRMLDRNRLKCLEVINTPQESYPFGAALRMNDNPIELVERDQNMWSTLSELRDQEPEGRIATVNGAAHVVRARGASLFDKVEASGKFDEVIRGMLFAERLKSA